MAAQVLDSPFARLKDLMVELCEEQKLPILHAFMRIALSMIWHSVHMLTCVSWLRRCWTARSRA